MYNSSGGGAQFSSRWMHAKQPARRHKRAKGSSRREVLSAFLVQWPKERELRKCIQFQGVETEPPSHVSQLPALLWDPIFSLSTQEPLSLSASSITVGPLHFRSSPLQPRHPRRSSIVGKKENASCGIFPRRIKAVGNISCPSVAKYACKGPLI